MKAPVPNSTEAELIIRLYHRKFLQMTPTLRQILPVAISIAIIIGVAILRNYSRALTAIFATMPINLPLTLWIVSQTDGATPESMNKFGESIVIGLIPTFLFAVVAWLGLRAGWSTLAVIAAGYLTWGVLLGVIALLRGGL